MLVELIKLTSLLLAFTLLLTFVYQIFGKSGKQSKLTQGVLFGLIAAIGMTMPVHFMPGVIFDPRSVLISIAGLFGGPIVVFPAAMIAAGYRLWLGGVGAFGGALVVFLSGLVGIGGYYLRARYRISASIASLFIFGFVCHFVAIWGLLVLPSDIKWAVIAQLAVPFFIIYPPLTMLLGALINFISRKVDVEEELVATNAQLQSVFDGSPDLMSIKSADGVYLMCNRQNERLFGVPVSTIQGKTDYDFLDEPIANTFREEDLLAIASGETVCSEQEVVFANGQIKLLGVSKTPIYRHNKELIGVLSVAHDLTQRAEVEAKLKQSAIVFESTTEGVVITDSATKILDVNKSFSDITGYDRNDVIGRDTRVLSSGRHDKDFYKTMWETLLKKGSWSGEIWNKRKDGRVFPEWLTISEVRNKAGELTNYIAVFTDISAIKESQDKLNYLAHHDALTGLPNRLLLNERLEGSISRAGRHNTKIAILFIDIDRFKNINDSFGHKAGDDLLQHISNGLRTVTRKEDLIARISGDEFVVVLEDIVETDLIIGAIEKIMAVVSSTFLILDHTIRSTASIGVSIFPMDGDNVTDLISNADAAMYRAKEEGRNTYQFYTRDLTEKALTRVVMENELREAMVNREFVLYYQPQIDLVTKKIVGLEALLRWNHPTLGLVPPDQFIPLAEDSGLINPIGEWVIYEAARQGKKWLVESIEFGRIAVNISSVQINKNQLVSIVSQALNETGLPPSCLELEVTEGAVMKRAENAIKQMHQLRALGIALSVDDFGTGYSSLRYLQKLPITKLKIDQSFVKGIPGDQNNQAIINTVINLGTGLGLTVIAEGVENESQEALLRELKCHQAQGYLYSKPLNADDIEQILSTFEGDTLK